MARPVNTKRKPTHGDYKEYKYYGCRCRKCKAAIAEYVAEYRARGNKGKDLTHGTRSAYNNGCRCDDCRDANRAYFHSAKKVNAAA